jgi:hypothetical protein
LLAAACGVLHDDEVLRLPNPNCLSNAHVTITGMFGMDRWPLEPDFIGFAESFTSV